MRDFFEIDFRDMKRLAFQLDAAADQLPFIMATALNEGAKKTKSREERELDIAFDRPTPFTKKSFLIDYAKKKDLKVTLRAKKIQNEYLKKNVFGGKRKPKKKFLPVPGAAMRLNQYGNMSKSAIKRAVANKDVFVGKPRGHPDKPLGIYRRTGKGAGKGKIKLLALFSGTQKYDPRYDFGGVFRRTVTRAVKVEMRGAVARAMKTRRRR